MRLLRLSASLICKSPAKKTCDENELALARLRWGKPATDSANDQLQRQFLTSGMSSPCSLT
jgi:hypothetical protein